MTTHVGDVMTARHICCSEHQDIDEVLEVMFKEGIHRLPVVGPDGDGLVGLVTLADLAAALDKKFVAMIVAEDAHPPTQAD